MQNKQLEKDIIGYVGKAAAGYATKLAADYAQKVVASKLSERPQKITNLINKYGDRKIIELSMCRTPVSSFYKALLYFVSYGQLSAKQKRYNYDDIFHLFINLKLDNGLTIGMEKTNDGIILSKDGIPIKENTECKTLNTTNKNLSLSSFIQNGEKKGGNGFYRYNIYKDNSQKFVFDLLVGSDIKSLQSFVLQNIDKIVSDPKLRKLSTKISDAYALYKAYTDKSTDIEYGEPADKVMSLKTTDEKINYLNDLYHNNNENYNLTMKSMEKSYPETEREIVDKMSKYYSKENEPKVEEKIEVKQEYINTRRPSNTWLNHLDQYRKDHPKLSFKEALHGAKMTYKK